MPSKERNRYREEEKVRGLRNKQKRGHSISILPDPPSILWNKVLGVGMIVGAGIAITYIYLNDVTGVGVLDDFLAAPLGIIFKEGTILLFN